MQYYPKEEEEKRAADSTAIIPSAHIPVCPKLHQNINQTKTKSKRHKTTTTTKGR